MLEHAYTAVGAALRERVGMAREGKAQQRYQQLVLKRTETLIAAGQLAYHDEAGRDYFHRPGEVLVTERAFPALADALAALGADEVQPERGLRLVRVRLPIDVDLHRAVLQLRKDAGLGAGDVGPHHALFGAPRYHGCPGRPPSPGKPIAAALDERAGKGVLIAVLDTGLAEVSLQGDWVAIHVRPGAELDVLDDDSDGRLDLAAGHGTFITGVIAQVAPGAEVLVLAPLTPGGVTDDVTAARAVLAAIEAGAHVLNLSFGGYTEGDAPPLALAQVLGDGKNPDAPVVVAAAGNDGLARAFLPAALPGVVAVGALNASGRRAGFSNFGPWVSACADGDRILSTYITGTTETDSDGDGRGDEFEEPWAFWSGTSFAAPQVAAAIAVRMEQAGETARQAVDALLHGPGVLVRTGLGTHVLTSVRSHPAAPGRP